jgi:serine-type D-Ala-D-Ala carboxypeptidase/endopeptidase
VLEQYVGEYRIAPGFGIAVTREGGALFVKATNQPRFPIFAEAEDHCFLRVADAQITFQRDAGGVVTGLVPHPGGRDIPGPKVR